MKYRTALPYFPKEDIDQILTEYREIFEGNYLFAKGPKVNEFEKMFSGYIGSKYGIAVNSGTSALEICLKAIGIKKGDEVIVPVQTFVSTGSCVVNNGGTPIFCEIDQNHLIDIEDLKNKITPATKAVIIVHFCGLIHPQIIKLKNFLDKKNIILIEDAAHAHGAKIDNTFAGNIGDFGCFSFYSTKIMTTAGEGGLISTNNSNYFKLCSSISAIGIDKESKKEIYHLSGSNNRMTEIQAIAGLSQLSRLDDFVNHRNNIAGIYREKLAELFNSKIISFQDNPSNILHPYWRFLVNVEDENFKREIIKTKMSAEGIVVDWPYSPLMHLQPAFKNAPKQPDLSKSESLAEKHLCLPLHMLINKNDAVFIANKFIDCFKS
jgi:perosamine synthetase